MFIIMLINLGFYAYGVVQILNGHTDALTLICVTINGYAALSYARKIGKNE